MRKLSKLHLVLSKEVDAHVECKEVIVKQETFINAYCDKDLFIDTLIHSGVEAPMLSVY